MSGMRRWSLRDVLLSEAVAWAVQNGIGILCSTLFVTVVGLRFPLACLVSVFTCVALLVFSPDRSAGARIFAACTFCACVCCGVVLGGALVSLAFVARGAGQEPLMWYLPAYVQEQGLGRFPTETVAQLDELPSDIAQLTVSPLPPGLQDALQQAADQGLDWLRSELPSFGGGFWTLLIILTSIILVPLSLGRSRAQGTGVLLTLMPTLMTGLLVSFGWMTQLLTLRQFWEEIVVGFIYGVLATAACSLAAGCLVCVRSAHDEVRASAAAIMLEAGRRISRLSSSLLLESHWQPPAKAAAATPVPASGGSDGAVDPYGEQDLAELQARLAWALDPSGPEAAAAVEAAEAPPPDDYSLLQAEAARLERSLGLASVEPPLPGLCSQPGADLQTYQAVKREIELLAGAMFALNAACSGGRLADMGCATGVESQLAEVRAALAQGLGLAAAACVRVGDALACMPAFGPCYGPGLAWRPIEHGAWSARRAELARAGKLLVDVYSSAVEADGLDFGLSVNGRKARALLFTLPTVIQLLWRVEAVEGAAAAALWVPTAAPSQPTPAAADAAAAEGKCGDLETGGDGLAAEGAAKGDADGAAGVPAAGAAAERAAASGEVPPTTPKRGLLSNPYLLNVATLLALVTGAAAWAAIIKGTVEACRGLPAALSSRAAFAAALRRPANQFALKYWLGLSLSMVGVQLFIWKGPRMVDILSESTLFFNWQPMYFWMAAVIVIQPHVEGGTSRGVMRVIGVFVGAMLGLAAGANGHLFNNPFYLSGMTVLLVAAFSLLAPVPDFRYMLTMVSYTAVSVLVCTYAGCCAVPVTWQDMAAKAVPTALGGVWGLIVTLTLPNFASNELLAEQGAILRACSDCLHGLFREHRAAALERRAPDFGPQLAQLAAASHRITAVGASIGVNTLDPRVMPLTSRLLRMPPAARMMQPALRAVTGSMLAAVFAAARVDFRSSLAPPPAADGTADGGEGGEGSTAGSDKSAGSRGKKGGKKGGKAGCVLQATPYGAAGDYFRVFAESPELTAAFEAVLAAHHAVVEACAENLEQGRSAASMHQLRAHVTEAAAAAAASRLELQRCYSRLRPTLLARSTEAPCGEGDVVALAFVHGFVMAMDQLLGVVRVLQAAAAQERESLGGWLQAVAATRGQV